MCAPGSVPGRSVKSPGNAPPITATARSIRWSGSEARRRIFRDDAPPAKLAKLEALFGRSGIALDPARCLLPRRTSVHCRSRRPPLVLAPGNAGTAQGRADRASGRMGSCGLAETAPVCWCWRTRDWIDATTQELMTRLIWRVAAMHALIVVTARPDFARPGAGRARVGMSTLDRLVAAMDWPGSPGPLSRREACKGNDRGDRRQKRRQTAVPGGTHPGRPGFLGPPAATAIPTPCS